MRQVEVYRYLTDPEDNLLLLKKWSIGSSANPLPLSCLSQQAFNATNVVRHMRRLQLGSSMGSSMDASNPQNQSQPAQNQSQPAQSQSADATAGKTSSTDNNLASPRKECEYEAGAAVRRTHVFTL